MELRDKLQRGDIRLIATMAGAPYETTRSILTGRRGRKRGGEKIKAIAIKFIAIREEIAQQFSDL